MFKTGIYDVLNALLKHSELLELDKPMKKIQVGKYDDLLEEETILNKKKEIFSALKQYKVNHSLAISGSELLSGHTQIVLKSLKEADEMIRTIN